MLTINIIATLLRGLRALANAIMQLTEKLDTTIEKGKAVASLRLIKKHDKEAGRHTDRIRRIAEHIERAKEHERRLQAEYWELIARHEDTEYEAADKLAGV